MKKFNILLLFSMMAFIGFMNTTTAQIWEPEGLSLPGQWNGWTNPPTNNLALASYTQVVGGQVTKISNGTNAHWQTKLHAALVGGNVVGGSYDWLFTSGPGGNPWANKWAGVNVTMNSIQNYTFNNGADNNVTLTNDKWYTINWEDIGYMDSKAIFMETTNQPVSLNTVSVPAVTIQNTAVGITVTTNAMPSPEEVIYIRYSTDNWVTSSLAAATFVGSNGTASIPGFAASTTVKYYAFSTTMAGLSADYDLQTINLNNNSGANYSYVVGNAPVSTIGWCNVQWPASGNIEVGQTFNVYGQVWLDGVTNFAGQGANIQAWIGYSTTNTNPSTWVNWVPATFQGDAGNNDEFVANLGAAIPAPGNYFYAYRYQYMSQTYSYGGFSGGFWNGTSNVSGTITVANTIPISNWAFAAFGLFALTFIIIRYRK